MTENDNMQLFERRLLETVTWCLPRVSIANAANCLRSLESQRPEITELSGRGKFAEHQAVVESVAEEREQRLRASSQYPKNQAISLHGGQLLSCDPRGSLECGGAENDSDGYINVYDIPPCDTWIFFDGDIICWVPKEFIDYVNDGIACACGNALDWVKDLDTPFARQLQQAQWMK